MSPVSIVLIVIVAFLAGMERKNQAFMMISLVVSGTRGLSVRSSWGGYFGTVIFG